ncbi:hypothetical protein [Treponema sp.]|uniref:hypothetical protein n=1 Tax=Treponema sp. TaxID=166 RepID=UPI00298DB0CE|nr:hypothetical protein [Treponema sp.]MCR5613614.1 hypothetical protein [Treponema sp.]
MKKNLAFGTFLSLLSLVLFSCSNSAGLNASLEDKNIKTIVAQKNEEITWTKEIEKSILSQKIDSIDYINSSLPLTPDVIIAYDAGMPHKNVYPYLEGFESLDVSDLDAEAANVIAQFCTNLVRKESCDSFMAKDSVYALAMFLYDAGECSFDFTNARWLLGKPFVTESSLEVPAYFYHKSDYLSIKFYLSQVENAYKVFDVEISDTGSRSHLREEKNGK